MELVNFDVSVLIIVNLVEAVSESETTLDQNLDQMIKDFVLCVFSYSLLL